MFKKFIMTILISPLTLLASIEQIHTIKDVANYFETADDYTLGIFDIDETLLVPLDPSFQKLNIEKHIEIITSIKSGLSLEQQDLLGNLALFASSSQLIESNEAPLLIQAIMKKNIRLMALTAAMTKKFEEGYLPEARYIELKKNGIDFSDGFREIQYLCLSNLKSCHGSHPVFYQGVLCSNGDHKRIEGAVTKGEALIEFLNSVSWKPSKIIFIDDKLYNLEEMEKTLKEFDDGITYQGLHYVGAQLFISPEVSPIQIESKWRSVLERLKSYLQQNN